jgi:hypothetical protein
VRLAEQAGDSRRAGFALLDLADAVTATDPGAGAEAARSAAEHARRAGDRSSLAIAIGNLAQALLMLGDWSAAEEELTHAADADGLDEIEFFTCFRGWLAALRGDATAAETMLAGLHDLKAHEAPQEKAMISLAEAFTAAARHHPKDALRHARATLVHARAIGISHDMLRWAWPLAARAAHELGDTATTGELLALLDSYQPGHLAPMLRAERDIVRARLADHDGGQGAGASFVAAIRNLRELSTPYHLAHGLLDHAEYLTGLGDAGAAAAIGEAHEIAERLRCQPLLDRAETIQSVRPRAPAP